MGPHVISARWDGTKGFKGVWGVWTQTYTYMTGHPPGLGWPMYISYGA